MMNEDSTDLVLNEFKKFWKLLQEPIFQINNSKVSVTSLCVSALVVIASIFLAKYLGKIVKRTLSDRHVDSGVRDSLEKFLRYLLIAIGVLFALDNLGVSISSLAAVGAVLMVGIGFGLQNIAQNFISGIILLIERPIKVGDIVRVGSSSGRVMDIRVRSSIIRTRDNLTIIVPNSKFLAEEVVSESYSGEKIRHKIKVGVAYGSDVALVKSLLCEAASSHEATLKDPAPHALFQDFGSSSLDFELRFWSNNIWQIESVSSDIRTNIDAAFRKNDIAIPFPQQDVYIKNLPAKEETSETNP